jgi:tryptophanyl-tRNA synthetase
VLKNWVKLQSEHPCLFFVADWHALTTDYEKPGALQEIGAEMVIDWLASGVDPNQATLFVQSLVPEHAGAAPAAVDDDAARLAGARADLQGPAGEARRQGPRPPTASSAIRCCRLPDIMIYRAQYVPVGEDQVPHIEFTRELARRFNHLYGREAGYEDKAKAAVKKMGSKKARLFNDLRTKFLENGDAEALKRAQALLDEQQNMPRGDRERLYGWLEGSGKKFW